MSEFLKLLPPSKALSALLAQVTLNPKPEIIKTITSIDRITYDAIFSSQALPAFDRSSVDGYAVKAEDTFGASANLPAYLDVVGEVLMGNAPDFQIGPGQCSVIHTGGMLPKGANAVIMIEYTQGTQKNEIEITRAAADGENTIRKGEDVKVGEEVIPNGIRIRPAEVGGLMALGITSLTVAKKPAVAILSSGDEVVSPYTDPRPGEIRDINTYTLKTLVEQFGGRALTFDIIPDDPKEFHNRAEQAISQSDIVLFTAGSSVSVRDLTARTINQLGKPGIIVHGINIRPGKPTILAICKEKPVIGLPGNPVSALIIANIFVKPLIEMGLGLLKQQIKVNIKAKLLINISSRTGREDWIPVKVTEGRDGYEAEPVFGKSNLIFTLTKANGLLRIHPDANGLSAGKIVEVTLF